ncbi:MAG: hypothetical protein N4A35_02760 [Flavobacteriales bacterium]|jgi:hypothetical protein|nr:hypothetical protein [Flavobacteriales bacterium]
MKRIFTHLSLILLPALIKSQTDVATSRLNDKSSKEQFASELVKKDHKSCIHASPVKPIVPDNVKKIIQGEFTQPLFNPQGEGVIYTNAKGDALYYQKTINHTPAILLEKSGVGNNIGWSKDGDLIYYKEKTKDYRIIVKSMNVNTKEIKEYQNYPRHIELRSLSISDTIYYLNEYTLAVEAKWKDKTWPITTEKGNYYKILISPNNKYIAVHRSADVLLFSTDGQFIRNFGRGIATSWSPDSNYLIGFMDESSDGHTITGSELLMFDINKGITRQITATENAFEMWPVFKSNNEILYTDDINRGLFSMYLNK